MRLIGRIIVIILALVGLVSVGLTGLVVWAVVSISSLTKGKIEQASTPDKVVLELDLEAGLRDGPSGRILDQLGADKALSLRDVVDGIDRAAHDDRVTALFATVGQTDMGLARAQEVRDAVIRFRASGKPTVVFSESMGEFGNGTLSYYLASAFGQIWLQPSGDVGLTGMMLESPFLRGTLDLLGVKPEFAGRKEYKTAIETFTEKQFSPANAEVMNAMLDSWSGQVIDGIAQSRKMPVDKVKSLFGTGPFLASEALQGGLVDKLGYHNDAWNWTVTAAHQTAKMGMGDYIAAQPKPKGTKVALIIGEGAIRRGKNSDGLLDDGDGIAAASFAQAIRDAVDDPKIKAILLRIDSPGGSYVASDTIWNEISRARRSGKPVVASMGNAAASGGYFIAMAADRIVAQPGTITGSIGVFSGKMVLADLWPKLGVAWDEAHRGDNAGIWSANRPFSPQEWDRMNTMLDHIYDDFTTKAAEGRHMPKDKLEALARGRVWTGAQAKGLGLVDALGGFDVARTELRQLLELNKNAPLDLVIFPRPRKPWEMVAQAIHSSNAVNTDPETRALLSTMRTLSPILKPLAQQWQAADPAQGALRLPMDVSVQDQRQ